MATLKGLEKEVNELKAKVSTLAKSRSKQWWIVAGVGLVLIVVLLITVFKNKPSEDLEGIKKRNRTPEKVEPVFRQPGS